MSEAAPRPAPEQAPRLEELMAQLLAETREVGRLVLADIAQRGPLTELMMAARRQADIEGTIRDVAMRGAIGEQAGPLPALEAVPGPEPGRHRARRSPPRIPGERPMWPRSAGALIPAGVLAALSRAWAAHHAALTAVTAATVPVVALAASATLTPPSPAHAAPHAASLRHGASVSADAVPVPAGAPAAPSPSGAPAVADGTAKRAVIPGQAAPSATASSSPSAPPSPSASPSPSPSPSSLPDPAAAAGTEVTLSAPGGAPDQQPGASPVLQVTGWTVVQDTRPAMVPVPFPFPSLAP